MSWWTARSVRERRLLATMAALVALVLLWFALIRPLMDARARADARLQAAATALAQARADAESFNRGAQAQGGVPRPLAPFLTAAAAEQGFTNMVVAAGDADAASITSAQVRPGPFFGWLGQLEARGITIRSLTASANADQTISIQATLGGGSE